MMRALRAFGVAALAAFLGTVGNVSAQDYPTGPVKVVVGFAPGGFTDVLARAVSDGLSQKLGKPFFLENVPGAGGRIGATQVAQSAPDGNTLMVGSTGTVVANLLAKDTKIDFEKDFAPVNLILKGGYTLVINSNVPAKNFDEFVAYAKANPGKLNFGALGPHSITVFIHDLMKRVGIEMTEVSYKSSADGAAALLSGEIDFFLLSPLLAKPQVDAGKIVALAYADKQRSSLLPDVPASAEVGLPGYAAGYWIGLLAPKDTPAHIIDKLNATVTELVNEPKMGNFIRDEGAAEPLALSSQEFAAEIKADTEYYLKAIAELGMAPQ